MKIFKKSLFKFMSVVIAASIGLVGCHNTTAPEIKAEHALWGAPATEKILQDVHEYSAISTAAEIDVDTAKGEYESAQIVITAGAAIKSYDVTLSDLKLKDGDEIYSKNNITVYNAKYLKISSPWTDGAIAGWYPDALLLFDKAKEYGENTIAATNNQSLYFSFNTPLDQPAGIYEGNVVITIDGQEETVPVTLRVRNVEVSEKVNVRSFFINTWTYYLGEYESTQAMQDAYTKALLDYRISPTSLVFGTGYTAADAKYYAEKAYELCANDRCSTIGIPVRKTDNGIPNNEFTEWLVIIAEKCLETKYDLLEKCYVYGVDEPIPNNKFEQTKAFHTTFMAQRQNAVARMNANKEKYLAQYQGLTESFFDRIVASMAGVRFVTTTAYRAEYAPYVDIWCPQYDTFESGFTTGVYDDQSEIWFYGAVSPKAPYPTYHMDDIALSPRMVGWFQGIYNVQGNLYWATNVYADWRNGGYAYPDDYYSDPSHYNNVNGDGFLFYPGAKYGIYGPIPSVRIQAIRDGQEDFELIYAIKEYYKKISEQIGVEFTADSTIKDLASSLYMGMQVTATSATFKQARTQLLNLSEFTRSGICFADFIDNGEGLITYKLYIPNGVSVKVTGAESKAETAVQGGKMVTYQVDMNTSNVGEVVFSTQIDGVTVSVERKLMGKVKIFDAEMLKDSFKLLVDGTKFSDIETEVIDGTSIAGEAINVLRFDLAAGQSELCLIDGEIFDMIGNGATKAIFNFYSDDGEHVIPVQVFVKYKGKFYAEELTSTAYLFDKGQNAIEWKNLTEIKWDTLQAIEYISFLINNGEADFSPQLYLKNIVLYSESEV